MSNISCDVFYLPILSTNPLHPQATYLETDLDRGVTRDTAVLDSPSDLYTDPEMDYGEVGDAVVFDDSC